MNKLLKNILIGVIGIVAVIATISLFYLIGFDDRKTGYIGLAFVIFSQVALFLGMMIST
jgi:uncharacterized membrane protein